VKEEEGLYFFELLRGTHGCKERDQRGCPGGVGELLVERKNRFSGGAKKKGGGKVVRPSGEGLLDVGGSAKRNPRKKSDSSSLLEGG